MFTITYVFVIITHQQEGVPVYYFGILYHCNLLLLALRTKLAFKAQDTPNTTLWRQLDIFIILANSLANSQGHGPWTT